MEFERAFDVIDILESRGYEARIVGGAVRDYLANRPIHDIDIATTALPEKVHEVFTDLGHQVIPTGLQHGTVTLVYKDETFEVTTLRVDVRTDGRHAEVRFTDDWRVDASRRDFTINAMSMDKTGRVFDYFGGRVDLKAGIVRFVGDAETRITEDYLRILRFFRFCADLGCDPAKSRDFDLIRKNVQGLSRISEERILVEVMKIVQRAGSNKDIYRLLNSSLVSDQVFRKNLVVRAFRDMGQEDWELTLHSMGIGLKFFERYKASSASIKKIKTIKDVLLSFDAGHSPEFLLWTFGHQEMSRAARFLDHFKIYDPDMILPRRPFDGFKVMKRFPLISGPQLGRRLHDMTLRWCDSKFTLTFDELAKEYDYVGR